MSLPSSAKGKSSLFLISALKKSMLNGNSLFFFFSSFFCNHHVSVLLQLVSNSIFISCQPHRVTSGQSNSVVSNCTFQNSSHIHVNLLPHQSTLKTNHFANIKQNRHVFVLFYVLAYLFSFSRGNIEGTTFQNVCVMFVYCIQTHTHFGR